MLDLRRKALSFGNLRRTTGSAKFGSSFRPGAGVVIIQASGIEGQSRTLDCQLGFPIAQVRVPEPALKDMMGLTGL